MVALDRNRWWNLGPQRTDWSPGALNPGGLGSAQWGRQAAEPETGGGAGRTLPLERGGTRVMKGPFIECLAQEAFPTTRRI